jgi:hypothetical protein
MNNRGIKEVSLTEWLRGFLKMQGRRNHFSNSLNNSDDVSSLLLGLQINRSKKSPNSRYKESYDEAIT